MPNPPNFINTLPISGRGCCDPAGHIGSLSWHNLGAVRPARRRQMRQLRWGIFWLVAALVILATIPVKADVLDKTMKVGGTAAHHKVVLPKNYDAGKAYPGILGFGGGPQTMNVVDNVIARNFRDEAEKRGYIVVVPAAPNDDLFFEAGASIFPEFLKQILADYKIRDNKFHIAGPSNGGISAFHVASLNPDYFLSITAF